MRETLIYLSHLDHEDTEKQVCDCKRIDILKLYTDPIDMEALNASLSCIFWIRHCTKNSSLFSSFK